MSTVVDLHPEELLDRLASGALSPSEQARLLSHIETCSVCRLEYELRRDFAEETAAVDLLRPPSLPFLAQIERPAAVAVQVPRRASWGKPRRVLLLAAAAVMLAGGALAGAWSQIQGSVGTLARTVAGVPFAASPDGGRKGGRMSLEALRGPLSQVPPGGVSLSGLSAPAAVCSGGDTSGRLAPSVSPLPVEPGRRGAVRSARMAAPRATLAPQRRGRSDSAASSADATRQASPSASFGGETPFSDGAQVAAAGGMLSSSAVDVSPVSQMPPATAAPPSSLVAAPPAEPVAMPLAVAELPPAEAKAPATAPVNARTHAPAQPTAASLFAEANAARRSGDSAAALRLYRELQGRFPRSPEARLSHASLGRVLLDRGDAEGALEGFDRYLARGGAALDEEALVGRAMALGKLGKPAAEASAWRELLRRYPASVHARYAKARIALSGSP